MNRVQFSLQNTIWVDPLVEKKVLNGIQTKAYSLDIGRDLINMGYAEKNLNHLKNLRKLLYDIQGWCSFCILFASYLWNSFQLLDY